MQAGQLSVDHVAEHGLFAAELALVVEADGVPALEGFYHARSVAKVQRSSIAVRESVEGLGVPELKVSDPRAVGAQGSLHPQPGGASVEDQLVGLSV